MRKKTPKLKKLSAIDKKSAPALVVAEAPAVVEVEQYQLTFLADQSFKGKFYKEGTVLVVEKWVKDAYCGRSLLRFELLNPNQ